MGTKLANFLTFYIWYELSHIAVAYIAVIPGIINQTKREATFHSHPSISRSDTSLSVWHCLCGLNESLVDEMDIVVWVMEIISCLLFFCIKETNRWCLCNVCMITSSLQCILKTLYMVHTFCVCCSLVNASCLKRGNLCIRFRVSITKYLFTCSKALSIMYIQRLPSSKKTYYIITHYVWIIRVPTANGQHTGVVSISHQTFYRKISLSLERTTSVVRSRLAYLNGLIVISFNLSSERFHKKSW